MFPVFAHYTNPNYTPNIMTSTFKVLDIAYYGYEVAFETC